MTRITKVKISGRTFYICQDRRGFWGIESKRIIDGKIPEKLDPVRDNLRGDVGACIRAIKTRIKVENLIGRGMSPADAAMKVIFG